MPQACFSGSSSAGFDAPRTRWIALAALVALATTLSVGAPPSGSSAELRIGLPEDRPVPVDVAIGGGGVSIDLPRGAVVPLDATEATSGIVRRSEVSPLPGDRLRLTLVLGGGSLEGIRYEAGAVVLRLTRRGGDEAVAAAVDAYRIGINDKLQVTTNGEIVSKDGIVVDPTGSITVPLVGEVKAAGSTTGELASRLTDLLGRDYLSDPRVDVQVLEYRSQYVMVTGMIRTPGRVWLKGSSTLKDVLAEAGGFTDDAGSEITISKAGSTDADHQVRVARDDFESGAVNPPVATGDIVNVVRVAFVYVNGEVRQAGRQRLEKGMTLLKAITLCGGTTEWANTKNVQILREGGGAPESFDLNKIYDRKIADPELRPGDTVIVRRRFL